MLVASYNTFTYLAQSRLLVKAGVFVTGTGSLTVRNPHRRSPDKMRLLTVLKQFLKVR